VAKRSQIAAHGLVAAGIALRFELLGEHGGVGAALGPALVQVGVNPSRTLARSAVLASNSSRLVARANRRTVWMSSCRLREIAEIDSPWARRSWIWA
jgi:hypothetical protein